MVNCSQGWNKPLHIYKDSDDRPATFFKTRSFEDNKLIRVMSSPLPFSCLHSLPLTNKTVNNVTYYNTSVSRKFKFKYKAMYIYFLVCNICGK